MVVRQVGGPVGRSALAMFFRESETPTGFIPVFIPWFHTLVSYLGFYMSFLSGFMSFVPWLHTLVSDSGFIHAFIPYRQKRGFIP